LGKPSFCFFPNLFQKKKKKRKKKILMGESVAQMLVEPIGEPNSQGIS
jgi:hypothetical protein